MTEKLFIAALAAACAFALGVVGGWVAPPRNLSQPAIRMMTVVLGVAAVVLALAAVATPDSPGDKTTAGGSITPSKSAGVRDQATGAGSGSSQKRSPSAEPDGPPDKVKKNLLLTIDSGAGSPTLYSWHVDGTNRQLLGGTGSGITPVPIPGTSNMLSPMSPAGARTFGIYEVSLNGDIVRQLTSPSSASLSDEDVALATASKEVFVARTRTRMVDSTTGTVSSYELFEFPLARPSDARPLAFAKDVQQITVDATGGELAGQCAGSRAEPAQICVVNTKTGRRTHVPGAEGTTMSNAALSPDGAMLAYDAFKPNPYGESQVFVFDLAHHVTSEVSSLTGQNDQPTWAPGSNSCLAFHHFETARESIHIACRATGSTWSDFDTTATGSNPAWFSPSR
jgi:hypothetical protein